MRSFTARHWPTRQPACTTTERAEELVTFTKNSSSLNIKVNPQRRSLKAILLILSNPTQPAPEKCKNTLTLTQSERHGEWLAQQDLKQRHRGKGYVAGDQLVLSAQRSSKHNEPHKVLHRWQVYMGFLVKLYSTTDTTMHGSRVRLVNTNDGLFLEIERNVKCEMPGFHHQRCSDEHHGQTAPVCAVLEYMDPNNIPFNALVVGPTNSGKTQYLLSQL